LAAATLAWLQLAAAQLAQEEELPEAWWAQQREP